VAVDTGVGETRLIIVTMMSGEKEAVIGTTNKIGTNAVENDGIPVFFC